MYLDLFKSSMTAIEGGHVGAPGLVHTEAIPVHPPGLHIYGQVGCICYPVYYYPGFLSCTYNVESGKLTESRIDKSTGRGFLPFSHWCTMQNLKYHPWLDVFIPMSGAV